MSKAIIDSSSINLENKTSESEAINKLSTLVEQGEKTNAAARKIAEETGYKKKWLNSKLNKKLDK